MAKTVNASVIVTRDGKTEAQNFDAMGYATFVALQSALNGTLSVLGSWGAIRVAALAEGRQDDDPSGDCDLRIELRADHGKGTSEAVIGYTGLSAGDADQITGLMMQAVASVVSTAAPAPGKKP